MKASPGPVMCVREILAFISILCQEMKKTKGGVGMNALSMVLWAYSSSKELVNCKWISKWNTIHTFQNCQ